MLDVFYGSLAVDDDVVNVDDIEFPHERSGNPCNDPHEGLRGVREAEMYY